MQSETNYNAGNTTYMGINIVDRDQQLQTLLKLQQFLELKTRENKTGLIDFIELNGSNITLNRDQYRAYTSLKNESSSPLVTSTTATFVEDDPLSGVTTILNRIEADTQEIQSDTDAIIGTTSIGTSRDAHIKGTYWLILAEAKAVNDGTTGTITLDDYNCCINWIFIRLESRICRNICQNIHR